MERRPRAGNSRNRRRSTRSRSREGLAHFGIELGGKRLVRREHERRPPEARNHVRHGEGLARAGDAEQRLIREAVADALDEPFDGLGLITGRSKRLGETERAVGEGEHHGCRTARGSMKALESSTMKPALPRRRARIQKPSDRVQKEVDFRLADDVRRHPVDGGAQGT